MKPPLATGGSRIQYIVLHVEMWSSLRDRSNWHFFFKRRHRATHVKLRFRGHKGGPAQKGSNIVRAREEITGPRSGVGAGGDGVALTVKLTASGITLPESAPLSSYTCGSVVRAWRYGQALPAFAPGRGTARGRTCRCGFALHSLRIGVATKLAAGGDVPGRVSWREGRWAKDSNTFTIYTERNTAVDCRRVSKKLLIEQSQDMLGKVRCGAK